jgi:carboxypeptidase T
MLQKRNKALLFIAFSLFIINSLCAQSETYSKVKVFIENIGDIGELAFLNFDIDHYEGNIEDGISFFVSQDELQRLEATRFNFDVVIRDYSQYYLEKQAEDVFVIDKSKKSTTIADGFDFGSMGGFYTYDEIGLKLDEMKANYPNLITEKVSIGTTIEGREIWMVKISDNPEIDEPEATVYFDALHHAREPLSMATTINYMFWLLENYNTDNSVKYLVDNRELYFVPVVNPDGYVYNEQTNPNGGGLWRKNRKIDIGGCVGVDLNRNYGFGYANDASCSSSDPCSGTYRGEGPFSEEEAIAVRDFIAQINPNTGFSIHSTAGTYLMPYGYDTTPPDFEIYSEWASSFLDENEYTYGVTFQMLGYTSCGTTRDFLHSEGIYGWTPEIAGSGFWPQESEIFDLVAENIRPMYYQSWIAGAYLDVQSHIQLNDALSGTSFQLVVEVKNVGVGATAENVSVVVQTSSSGITTPTANGYGNIEARTKKDNTASPFVITIDPLFTDTFFELKVSTFQNGALNEEQIIPVYVGNKNVLFLDNSENGTSNWVASGNGIQWDSNLDDSYSGISCFGDSNGGNAVNNTINYFELNEVFNLTNTNNPRITFATKHSIESGDNVQFQISTNNVDWETLKLFTGNEKWMIQTIDLTSYKNFSNVKFRFSMETNAFIPGDGFYFDDFEVSDYDTEILDLSQILKPSEITVFPNPFGEKIYVNTFENELEITLIDNNGRDLKISQKNEGFNVMIENLNNLSAGVYFLNLKNKNGDIFTKKIIKQ